MHSFLWAGLSIPFDKLHVDFRSWVAGIAVASFEGLSRGYLKGSNLAAQYAATNWAVAVDAVKAIGSVIELTP